MILMMNKKSKNLAKSGNNYFKKISLQTNKWELANKNKKIWELLKKLLKMRRKMT
jgi:hypothetical protein